MHRDESNTVPLSHLCEDMSKHSERRQWDRNRLFRLVLALNANMNLPIARTENLFQFFRGIRETCSETSLADPRTAHRTFSLPIPFQYEVPRFAPDGTFYLPDFTVTARGEPWYWEHLGRLNQEEFRNHWETKKALCDRFFPGRLLVTEESGMLSQDADRIIRESFL